MRLGITILLATVGMICCCHPCAGGTSNDILSSRGKPLPLVELAVDDTHNDKDLVAVILTGDGGWAELVSNFGGALQKEGIATIGFDCSKYFWQARRPPEVTSDLETVLRHYLATWHKKEIVLVGFSFGACWLPYLTTHLPADLGARVRLVVLLSPGQYVNVEIKMGDWVRDVNRPGGLVVPEDAARIRQQLLCVYGREDEAQSLCPSLKGANMRIMPVAGDHHFNHVYAPIEKAILNYLATDTWL